MTKRLLLGIFSIFFIFSLNAQTFPSKPLKFIVPYPPGGGTDILGRALGQVMGESMGQTIIVENRPGANGALASIPAR